MHKACSRQISRWLSCTHHLRRRKLYYERDRGPGFALVVQLTIQEVYGTRNTPRTWHVCIQFRAYSRESSYFCTSAGALCYRERCRRRRTGSGTQCNSRKKRVHHCTSRKTKAGIYSQNSVPRGWAFHRSARCGCTDLQAQALLQLCVKLNMFNQNNRWWHAANKLIEAAAMIFGSLASDTANHGISHVS